MPPGDEYVIGYLFIPTLNLREMSDTLTRRTGQFRGHNKTPWDVTKHHAFGLVQGYQTAAAVLAKFNPI